MLIVAVCLAAFAGSASGEPSLSWGSRSVPCEPPFGESQYFCSSGVLRVHVDPNDETSPTLALPVFLHSARNASAAPPPGHQGYMLNHCGGPGSGRECAYSGGFAGLGGAALLASDT